MRQRVFYCLNINRLYLLSLFLYLISSSFDSNRCKTIDIAQKKIVFIGNQISKTALAMKIANKINITN
jgi:hypothetical protein